MAVIQQSNFIMFRLYILIMYQCPNIRIYYFKEVKHKWKEFLLAKNVHINLGLFKRLLILVLSVSLKGIKCLRYSELGQGILALLPKNEKSNTDSKIKKISSSAL